MDRALQASEAICMRVLAGVALSLATLSLALVGSATATVPTWLASRDLSAPGENSFRPDVAIDQQGNATAVWERFDGSNWIVRSAERPVGGAWSEPVDLSAAGQDAKFSQVAIDVAGNATATWEGFNGSNWIVRSAQRPVGGSWSEPVDLSDPGQNAVVSKVAIDPQGNATAIWRRFNGSNWIIQSAERPAGGSWSEPVDLSAAGQDAKFPELAVNSQGNATAIWRRFNGSNWIIQSAERPAGGSWSEPVDLSAAGQDGGSPQVAVDAQGNAAAVWRRDNGSTSIIQSAVRPAGSTWSMPVDLSVAGHNASGPQVAVDPLGDATVTWEGFNGSNWIVQSTERPAGGAWSEPVDLSAASQDAEWSNVTVDPQGNATAAWQRFNGSNWIIQSAARPAGGSWSEPVDLSATSQNAVIPKVVVDSAGNATAIWQRFDGSNWIIQSAGRPAVTGDATNITTSNTPASPLVNAEPVMSLPIGRALAPRVARVARGKALLGLRCRGAGRCRGVVELFASTKETRTARHHRRRQVAKRRKRTLIGKMQFSIPANAFRVIRVRLNHKGMALLRNNRHHRLNVSLQGRGVKHRRVLLKEVRNTSTSRSGVR